MRATHGSVCVGNVGPSATLPAPDEIGMNLGVSVLRAMSGYAA
jgi:hypothetical protein